MHSIGRKLHDAVLSKFKDAPRGSVLDVGTESGDMAQELLKLGFQSEACDGSPSADWKHGSHVPYQQCDLNKGLPYADQSFDYLVCLEVIEHLDNPFALCRELRRVVRTDGSVYISTPNILSMRSRLKFLLDGSFLYFDWPPLEWDRSKGRPHVHVHPIRFHELEYYLFCAELGAKEVFTNARSTGWKAAFPLLWLIRLYARHMTKRSSKGGRIHLARIYERILSDDLLYGKHLIILAKPL